MQFAGLLVLALLSGAGCTGLLRIDSPHTEIAGDAIFTDDRMANSAVTGIYFSMISSQSVFSSGGTGSLSFLCALAADDLESRTTSGERGQFYTNGLDAENNAVRLVWASLYKRIFEANAVLEGLQGNKAVSPSLAAQLEGEALFLRAFCHFYLTACFGDVPLLTTTDYHVNRLARRSPASEVLVAVEHDLRLAAGLLPADYAHAGNERVRVNRWAAYAMLARLYLYTGQWQAAADMAGHVLAQSGLFSLADDPAAVFVANSSEVIWQLLSVDRQIVTYEAFNALNHSAANPPGTPVSTPLAAAFDAHDRRRDWVGQLTGLDGQVYHFPLKYKTAMIPTGTTLRPEYSTVLRLAEQYLIRAEARLQLQDSEGALADIRDLRMKRGLETAGGSSAQLMELLRDERRRELFCEWGHRWFDLKRWGIAEAVLAADPEKNLQPSGLLWPVPQAELEKNSNLLPQNTGY